MGVFKVYYLDRNGDTDSCTVRAANETDARRKAEKLVDDIEKIVPAENSWGSAFQAILIIAVVVAVLILCAWFSGH